MPWMTGPAWAQVQGLDNIYRSAPTPTPATAPSAPASGDYWSQLSSLLGMPQAGGQPAYTPWWQAQQQRAADVVPGAGMSIPGAGAYFAQLQQMQQQAQAPSNVYGNMPMLGQSGPQFLAGSNQGRANPFRRADGSVITPEAYMAGDRPGMSGRSNYQGQPVQPPTQRPTLAPPTTAGRRPKTPSATFGTPNEREPAVRPSIPGFSNFVY